MLVVLLIISASILGVCVLTHLAVLDQVARLDSFLAVYYKKRALKTGKVTAPATRQINAFDLEATDAKL